jgi:hypothetical protein
MQRKVSFKLNGTTAYCNLFIVLLGAPGVGKGLILHLVHDTLSRIPTVHLAPKMLSKEKLIHNMAKAIRPVPGAKHIDFQCAYAAVIPEFATFIRPNDPETINVILEFYDCKGFRYETLSREVAQIENTYFTLLAGTTPAGFGQNVYKPFSGTGFLSRLNLIYSEEQPIATDIFADKSPIDLRTLSADLQRISALYGQMHFTAKARTFIQNLVNAGIPPAPSDARFAEYNSRRIFHYIKLCCIASVSRRDDMKVLVSDAEEALSWLLEYEEKFDAISAHFGSSAILRTIQDIPTWIMKESEKRRMGIPERDVKARVLLEVQPQYVQKTIEEMVASGLIRRELVKGIFHYYPG